MTDRLRKNNLKRLKKTNQDCFVPLHSLPKNNTVYGSCAALQTSIHYLVTHQMWLEITANKPHGGSILKSLRQESLQLYFRSER